MNEKTKKISITYLCCVFTVGADLPLSGNETPEQKSQYQDIVCSKVQISEEKKVCLTFMCKTGINTIIV